MRKLLIVLGNFLFVILVSSGFLGASMKNGGDTGPIVLVLFWSILVASLAVYRRRRFYIWFLISCLLTPLISTIILFVKKKGMTDVELKQIADKFIKKYEESPENLKVGAAKSLYVKIKNNKSFSDNELNFAENALSKTPSNADDWK